MSSFFHDKWKLPRSLIGVLLVVFFYAIFGLILIVIGVQLFAAAKSFFLSLPSLYTHSIAPWMNRIFTSLQEFAARLDPEAAAAYNVVSANITSSLGENDRHIFPSRSWMGYKLYHQSPRILLKLLITVIATVFLTVDFPKIKAFIMRQLTQRWRDLLHDAAACTWDVRFGATRVPTR